MKPRKSLTTLPKTITIKDYLCSIVNALFKSINRSSCSATCVKEFFLCGVGPSGRSLLEELEPCRWTRLLMEPTSLFHSCSFCSGGDVPSHSTVGLSRAIFDERILIMLFRFVCGEGCCNVCVCICVTLVTNTHLSFFYLH